MANKKISAMTELSSPASGDKIPLVDVSDTTGAATGTTKWVSVDNLVSEIAVADMAASAVVLEAEGISSNDNDTTLPTSAAVKDYVDGKSHTTYTTGAVTSSTDAIIRLTGSDSSTDDVKLVADSNITLTVSGDNISIGAQDTNSTYFGGNGIDLNGSQFDLDINANGGLVITDPGNRLALDLSASAIPGTLAASDGGTGLTSISTLLNSNTTASDLSDFDTEVANNTAVTANTAKVTNATHTGEVTGDTALTVADDVIDEANLKADNSPTDDYVLTAKSSAAGGLTWAAASGGGGGGSGDITSVVAGTGLTGGATTGAATLNVDVGIADDKIAQIDSASVADDDFARFTANGLEGRSASEVLSDIGAAASGHAHGLNNLSDVDTTGAASGKIIKHNGSSWAVADDTDTNTNQLTTFTVSATTDTTATTISQGDDLMFAAGTGITCETTADGTVTIAATGGGTVTSVGGTGTVNGLTLTGTVTSSGNLTLGGTLPVEIGVACSDETTALTVADNKVRFMIPEAMTLTEVKASLVGAESDISGMDIDVRYHATDPTNAGATVFSGGDLNIAQNTYYGTKSSLAVTSLAENGFIMVDINGPFGSPDATGLKIWLIGTK